MALVLLDRAQETATANTTVSFTMLGASTGYQSLAGVGDTNTTYYGASDGTNWEVGIGTYSTTGPTLTRTTILSSSNSNTAVTFSGTVTVFVDYPSGKSVTTDSLAYPPAIGGTTPAAGKFTTLEATGTSSLGTASAQYIQAVGDALYPQVKAVGSGTDIPLVLQPKGTGALQAQKTDSTATGGNARGANAVDWQTSRGSATQVASGSNSTIGGGLNNTAGAGNTVVSGGANNNSAGSNSAICGGNGNIVGTSGFVGGGNSNQAGSGGSPYSAVVGGFANTANGYLNFIGGGYTNSGTSVSAVTTQSGTMNATTSVTLSGSNASIKVGQYITGTSIAIGTYVAAISGTSLTLSQAASGSSTSTLSFYTPHGVVVGGGNNQATGSYSFIGGGGDAGTAANRNVASGDWSTVGGGAKNTASGIASVVAGGGTDGAGFYANTASGIASVISGGTNNAASATLSTIIGGGNNVANAQYSVVLGSTFGTTRGIQGNTVIAANNVPITTTTGVSQSAILVLGTQTTDATATVLRSSTAAASGTNQVTLPNNSAYYFKGSVIANVTAAANGASWSFEGSIMRGANAASTVLIGTPSVNRVASTSGATAWSITVTADTTNGALAITVTGAAATTIRWVAKIETTEVTF